MNCQAVIGAGFGDEGKGKVVSYLCSHLEKPLVIRFSGGHQAGHHVVIDNNLSHVFSNFGSGTLQGIDTYWSKYCTIDPVGILNELDILKKKGVNPALYIDGKCPVTTPMDKRQNLKWNNLHEHGTCGVGFGQTLKREEDRYSLLFSDLFNKSVFNIKLNLIKRYYDVDSNNNNIEYRKYLDQINNFVLDCISLIASEHIKITDSFPDNGYSDYLFEGSQGLLLDQDVGFFPHVTRANTGTKNILSMGFNPYVYLVTRAYQTRHGNGPMTNESLEHNIKPNPFEQQEKDGTQGKFRVSPLDLDLLKYGIERDDHIKSNSYTLVTTCMDLIQDSFILTIEGESLYFKNEEAFIDTIEKFLNIKYVAVSRTPLAHRIQGFETL